MKQCVFQIYWSVVDNRDMLFTAYFMRWRQCGIAMGVQWPHFKHPNPVVYRFESVRGFNFHWSVVDVQKSWKMGRWALSPTSRIWAALTFWLFAQANVQSARVRSVSPSYALGEVMVGMFHETLHQGVPWVPRVSKPIPVAEPVTSSVAWKASGGA